MEMDSGSDEDDESTPKSNKMPGLADTSGHHKSQKTLAKSGSVRFSDYWLILMIPAARKVLFQLKVLIRLKKKND